MLVQSVPYPATPYLNGLDAYFSNVGATQPQIGPAIFPSALHDSANDLTWFGWEGWTGNNRAAYIAGYDHSTGYWSAVTGAGSVPLIDDDHGIPALCLDDEGHLHVFHGSHNTNQLHSSTIVPIAGASMSGLWRINPVLTGEYTYPHPVAMGSDIYLLLRKTISAQTKRPLVVYKTATLVAGVATWGSEITLVDFDTDSRFYMGTVLKSGTDIHIIATRSNEADTFREDIYYFIYKTATGAVTNHDGSYSVASGSLPVTLANADANCRIFTHGGANDDGGAPALCFDTNGDPHVIFKDGTGSSYAVKHIKKTSGSWSSPVTIATVDNRYNCPVLAPLAGGWVEAWYALDPLSAFTRFGNIVRRLRSPAGSWGAEQTIVEADLIGLGNPTIVLDGDPTARIVFSECLDSPLDSGAGDLRSYVYGDGGLIPYVAAPAATNAGTASGRELREDGDDCLREDGSFELRETA